MTNSKNEQMGDMAMTKWKLHNHVLYAQINGNDYELYETEPGMFRLRRNACLIAETFTKGEAKQWAEVYDAYLEKVRKENPTPSSLKFADMSDAWELAELPRLPRYPRMDDSI